MCRALSRIPIVGTFRRFYINSISNGWLSFSKRGGADDPCCYSNKFDSLKNWNNRFFWIDASVCPLSTSWFSGTSVVKDPLPVDEAVDLPCVELLNENRTLIRKYLETFLCFVGLSRSFTDTDVHPTLLHDNDEEMGLLDFVKSADPSLVDHTIQDELKVNSGKRKKRVAFASGSPPMKKVRAEGIVIFDYRSSTTGKSPSALRRLSKQNEQADTSSGSTAPATEDVTSSSVTPTRKSVLKDASHDNVKTRPPSDRFVVLSSGSAGIDIPASSQVVSLVTSAPTINASVVEPVGNEHHSSGSEPEAGALSATPSQEIADIKDQLEKSEAEVAEVIELRKRPSDLEAIVAIKVGELGNFHTENVGLVERVSAKESKRDSLKSQVVGEGKMREEFMLQRDAVEWRFAERTAKLDARIADDMDNDLYPHMLTAIASQRWVVGHGFRLAVYKVGRSLAQVGAYDPEVEGKYVVAVSKFEGISFPLLDELESLKDSPLVLIMFALILKDDHGNRDVAPEFSRFQPSIDQVVVPVYSESNFVDREMILFDAIIVIRQSAERRGLCLPLTSTMGEASGSAPPPDSSLGVADY
nr:hypothetical protein [Tanacetum cinerariifolium]